MKVWTVNAKERQRARRCLACLERGHQLSQQNMEGERPETCGEGRESIAMIRTFSGSV